MGQRRILGSSAGVYDDFKQMAIREARRKNGIEAVSIVTPNQMHCAAAREFLKRGFHVICDKPLTSTPADAKRMVKAVANSGAFHSDTQPHGLSDGTSSARDDRCWRTCCYTSGAGGIPTRPAHRGAGFQTSRMADRSSALRSGAAPLATSGPTRTIWRVL